MQRACKVTLKFVTESKRLRITALLRRYRAAVNFFIDFLWQGLPIKYQDLFDSPLSAPFRQAAYHQAQDIIKALKATPSKTQSKPVFNGTAILDRRHVRIEEGKNHFDLALRFSSLVKRDRITILTKKTEVLNKWLAVPGATLAKGCGLSDDEIILWIKLPDFPAKEEGKVIAIDVGINKLISDSDGNHYGTNWKELSNKIRRKKPGSNARKRSYEERNRFINQTVNQLPWAQLKAIGHERLVGLKTGKQKGRGRTFRKAIAPWTYRQLLAKIDRKALENRVRPVEYDPRDTSRTCPECRTVRKDNRKGERFSCRNCGYAEDADTVGARNGLVKTLATLGSV